MIGGGQCWERKADGGRAECGGGDEAGGWRWGEVEEEGGRGGLVMRCRQRGGGDWEHRRQDEAERAEGPTS